MVLGGVLIGMLGIREDQKDYFNIPDATTDELALVTYRGEVAGHRRNIHTNRLDDTTATRTRTIDRRVNISRNRKKVDLSKGGKPIKIPTELTSTPLGPASTTTTTTTSTTVRRPSVRHTTIRFPGNASNSQISRWLHTKLVSHKPSFFKTPAGVSYPIVAPAAATTTTTPATTPAATTP